MNTYTVNLSLRDTANIVEDYVLRSGISPKLVDKAESASQDGRMCVMMVFEKYFMRNSSRASLSVLMENMSGRTAVHVIGSGGGQGSLLSFDWGAADSFEGLIEKALRPHM